MTILAKSNNARNQLTGMTLKRIYGSIEPSEIEIQKN